MTEIEIRRFFYVVEYVPTLRGITTTIPTTDAKDGEFIGFVLFFSGFCFLGVGIIALIWLSRR